ncbi:MAG: hypothetical protein JKX72_06970 [Robiginitomaculum sp.]|nr:hypothetical protein [Robiginitomaculum sp.]
MSSTTLSVYAMAISLIALVTQVIFGVMSTRRAIKETDRQIAETKKQEKLHAINAEETYKQAVRDWGRSVVRAMALAQQLCKIDPRKFITSDYDLTRAETVATLRGLLDKAKWLFPNLAVPSREDESWNEDHSRRLSALESILHAYHVLDTVKTSDKKNRDRCVLNMRNLRKQFVREMRRAVDPQVRGEDIERLMLEVEAEMAQENLEQSEPVEPSEPAPSIGPGEASVMRK